MKRLMLPLLLVAGLLLLLIPGEALAASNCVIHSPANTTFTNSTAPRFEIRCYPEIINWSWAAGLGKIPQVNVSYSNGSGINVVLNLTMGQDNISAYNVSGSYAGIPNGSINATFYWYNTTSTVLNRLQALFTIDEIYPTLVTVASPINATYPSGAINVSCNTTSNATTWTYTVDNGANVTLSSSAVFNASAFTSTLADGTHNITCTATRPSNSFSNTSAMRYFTVNSSAPAIKWIDPTMLGAATFTNENKTINITVSSPWNISRILIDFPDSFWFGIGVNDTNVLFTDLPSSTTNVNRATNVIQIFNTTATVMPYANNYSYFYLNFSKNSTQTPPTDGDVNVTFAWVLNDSRFPTGLAVNNTTVTVRVRNLSAGPFLLNTTCGNLADTRTPNKSVTILPNASPCNLTYVAPFLSTGNDTTIENGTAYGWDCGFPCTASNRTVNTTATRWVIIEVKAPGNTTTVTLQVAQQTAVSGYLGPIAVAGAAGLAIVYGLRRKFRRGDVRTGK